ncbi:5-formyltetrahydrofolate cyclo-ligase, partial [Cardiobacterium sp. AH-315-I02]|nr:5-formyltetrahydrofolate cyclo-ligase [Cardiobacterium sp. AH-315-I02]
MPDDSMHNNAEIRQQKRAQRRLLSNTAQQQHALALCQNTIKERTWRCSQHIALYLANDSEIDPYLLMDHARLLGKKIYLPILAPLKNSLYFAPFETGQHLKLNRFNIPEPICHPSKWKTAW